MRSWTGCQARKYIAIIANVLKALLLLVIVCKYNSILSGCCSYILCKLVKSVCGQSKWRKHVTILAYCINTSVNNQSHIEEPNEHISIPSINVPPLFKLRDEHASHEMVKAEKDWMETCLTRWSFPIHIWQAIILCYLADHQSINHGYLSDIWFTIVTIVSDSWLEAYKYTSTLVLAVLP